MRDISLDELVRNLKSFFRKDENKNYLYLSIFFLVFSFFLFFVIRPTLKSAFKSRSKKEELLRATKRLEDVINKAVILQTEMEKYREDFDLLYEAIPERVKIAQVMRELEGAIREANLKVENASVSDINLVGKNKKGLKEVNLDYSLKGSFSDYLDFLKKLNSQRRLKIIEESSFLREGEIAIGSSSEANLNIRLKIKAFFL